MTDSYKNLNKTRPDKCNTEDHEERTWYTDADNDTNIAATDFSVRLAKRLSKLETKE